MAKKLKNKVRQYIEREWPSALAFGTILPNYIITEDPTFTRERTGAGSIEYFNEPYINYGTEENPNIILNPNGETPTLLYDPNTNTADDVKLDLLHHYREYDPVYLELLRDYEQSLQPEKGNILWNSLLGEIFREKYNDDDLEYSKHWDEWDTMVNTTPSNSLYMLQGVDGSLRNLLASDATIKSSNYAPREVAEQQWLSNPEARKAFNNIQSYLTSYRLPEVIVYGNRKDNGGPLHPDWNELSMRDRAAYIRMGVANGYKDIDSIRLVYNEFRNGGYLYGKGGKKKYSYNPSDYIKNRISNWEGAGMYKDTIDPLSGKMAKKNASFDTVTGYFINAIPENIRELVLSNQALADHLYSYAYNVGPARFKLRVVPALQRYYNGNGSIEDITLSMWASGDTKLRGLRLRREAEREGVRNALSNTVPYIGDNKVVYFNNAFDPIPPVNNSSSTIISTNSIPVNNVILPVLSSTLSIQLPSLESLKIAMEGTIPEIIVRPNTNRSYIPPTPLEVMQQRQLTTPYYDIPETPEIPSAIERQQDINKGYYTFLQKELEDNIIRNTKLGTYDPNRLVNDIRDLLFLRNMNNIAAYGGNLFQKGGKRQPTLQINIMAYHPEEDYWSGPASKFGITVTGHKREKDKPYWVSPKGAGNTALTAGDLSKAYTAATVGLLPNPISAGINLSQGKVRNALEDMWLYNSAHSEDPDVNYGVVGFSVPEGSLFSSISKAAKATPEQWTAAQDAAIARGDMAEAQRLRDLHFGLSNSKYKEPLFRGTDENSPIMDLSKMQVNDVPAVYLTPYEEYARQYGDNVRRVYLNTQNPWIDKFGKDYSRFSIDRVKKSLEKAIQKGDNTKIEKYRGILDDIEGTDAAYRYRIDGVNGDLTKIYEGTPPEILGRDVNKVKSADAVTYDDNGVRIPLGERDNFKLNDIRYGLLPFGIGLTGYGLFNNQEALGGNLFDGTSLPTQQMNIAANRGKLYGDGGFLSWLKSIFTPTRYKAVDGSEYTSIDEMHDRNEQLIKEGKAYRTWNKVISRKPNTSPTSERSTLLENKMYDDINNMRNRTDYRTMKYDIPYGEREIKVKPTDSTIPMNISVNALDSLAKYAGITGTPIETAIGLPYLETTFGRTPINNYGKVPGYTDREIGNSNYFRNFGSIPAEYLVRDFRYNSDIYNEETPVSISTPPLQHALEYFNSGKYNKNEKSHTGKVKSKGKALWNESTGNLKKWWNTEGRLWYNKGK